MPGPVALVGAGEFLPAMREFDAGLLAVDRARRGRASRSCRPPSYPDGEEVFTRWAAMGVAHFGELGAEVEPVLVRDRAGGRRSGRGPGDRRGRPDLPVGRQARIPAGRARGQRGRPGAGGRARARRGARRLLGRGDGPGRPRVRLPAAPRCPGRCAGGTGSGSPRARRSCPTTTPGRSRCRRLIALQAPRGSLVLGIDEETAARRAGRRVAGPRPVPGHGLARPPSRAASAPATRSGSERRAATGRATPLRPATAGRLSPA